MKFLFSKNLSLARLVSAKSNVGKSFKYIY